MNAVRRLAALTAAAALAAATAAQAQLPRELSRAFAAAHVPLEHVAVVVKETGAGKPLLDMHADRPMNPASVMKLVTTFAALELLGRDHRWRTEAYLGGPLVDGRLDGPLILKGGGDPKVTLEQWDAFVAALRAGGLAEVAGDLVLDRSLFQLPPHDPARFDLQPQRPYNVGPDALLLNFKSVRVRFLPSADGRSVDVVAEPPLPQVTLGSAPAPVDGSCNDWRAGLGTLVSSEAKAATLAFPGRFPRACGERDWHIALLDHPTYALGMFQASFAAAGGVFGGGVRDGRAPAGAKPWAVLDSLPLYEMVRDINKMSNNVMARQLFLSLALVNAPPPATLDKARAAVRAWLAKRRLALPGLVIDNGSGLSRDERITAGGLVRLLDAADASPVREEFASSLAVAALDGTVVRRFQNGGAAGQALLKTGSLEGVRALAGYVIDASGRRWSVAVMVNHANASRAQAALDAVVDWTWREAGRPSRFALPRPDQDEER